MISAMLLILPRILPIAATSAALRASPQRFTTVLTAAATSSGRSLHICTCSAMTFTESRHSNSALAHVASVLRFSNSAYAAASTGSCELDRSHPRTARSSAAIALSSPARPRRHRPLHRVATARSRSASRTSRSRLGARSVSTARAALAPRVRDGSERDRARDLSRSAASSATLGPSVAFDRLLVDHPLQRAWTTVAARRRF
mmetsp:Transcript_8488/g.34715  ORF Transcript_8488/g.34715 Transcript_8488/m.34715 type:complete len:202 (-) Transcript_8488:4332-4937(-)